MAIQLEMPKLSVTMTEGTVMHWLKEVGEPVKKGEGIVEVSSDKEVVELDAPEDGVLLKVAADEGETVACHSVIAYIGHPGEKVGEGAQLGGSSQTITTATTTEDSGVANQAVATAVKPNKSKTIKVSPVARKIATEAGLDLATITGTGPNGRITKEDVEKAKAEAEVATPVAVSAEVKQEGKVVAQTVEKVPLTGIRKVIASRMQESLQQSAQLTHHTKADITELLSLKKTTDPLVEKRYDGKFTVTDYIARAVVLALQEHKLVNSALIDDDIHIYSSIHLGIAADVENGLVVPVIKNADEKSIVQLSQSIKELATLANSKKLTTEQMTGSTFTISNLGSFGIEYFTPILNPPETAILGVGTAQATAVFVGEEIEKRTLLPLSLTFNHQVLDGAPAAEFLKTVQRYLEEPVHLLI